MQEKDSVLSEIINLAIKENAGAISILSNEQRTFGEKFGAFTKFDGTKVRL